MRERGKEGRREGERERERQREREREGDGVCVVLLLFSGFPLRGELHRGIDSR